MTEQIQEGWAWNAHAQKGLIVVVDSFLRKSKIAKTRVDHWQLETSLTLKQIIKVITLSSHVIYMQFSGCQQVQIAWDAATCLHLGGQFLQGFHNISAKRPMEYEAAAM